MKKLVALVMMAFLVPAAAYAKNPCKDDKVKFCKDVKASGGKVNDCLRQHVAEVSAACKEQLTKPKEGKPDKEKKEKKPKAEGDKKSDTTKSDAPKADAPKTDTTPPATGGAAPGTSETKP